MNTAQSLPVSTPTDNEILADKISELAAHIHAATYRFLMMVREFDEREAWLEMGARSCAHWLNWRCGISLHTAREKVRVAHALKNLDKTSAAFKKGELSYSKVRALTRTANKDNEDTLLNIALSGTASQLERVVRCNIRCEREADVVARTEAAHEQREFGWHTATDGSVEFFGRLPAELAEQVILAIEANLPGPDDISENLTKNGSAGTPGENTTNRPEEHSNKSSAKGSDESPDRHTGMSPDAGSDNASGINPENKPSLAMRRADALVALCNSHCEGYEVTLHVPAGTSLHASSLEKTGTIPLEAAKRICCDAAIVPVTETHNGHVLDIGRRTRKIPPAIRRALDIRDKGCCRFPGCTTRRFLKAHHIRHWAQGGNTCLDNLVLLCWQHHHLVHEGGFVCRTMKRKHDNGVTIIFATPNGVLIPDAFALKPAQQTLEAKQASLDIHPHTCDARDAGTPLDVNTVIDALAFIKRSRKKLE